MLISLLTVSLLMGLTGGPHCLMMCGPACSLLTKIKPSGTKRQANLLFLSGRAAGYAGMGALAATSMQSLGWLATQSTLFRPLWNMTHVLAMILGLFLLIFANQPLWLGAFATSIWRKIEQFMLDHAFFKKPWALFVTGVLWSLIPCSLLYSVLMVAALSAQALNGGLIMLGFSLGGALFMAMGSQFFAQLNADQGHAPRANSQTLVFRSPQEQSLRNNKQSLAHWGVRLAGLALFANSSWIMYNDLVLNQAPWCVSPA